MSEHIKFDDLFVVNKPIIGMIHLAGQNSKEKITRALEELAIYEHGGVNGVIIEDYHGSVEDVHETLRQSQGRFNLVVGVNVLRNPYSGFKLANDYDAKFVQFDSVQTPDLDLKLYDKTRIEFPNIAVLGGIGFKYTSPTGNPLEVDLKEGKNENCYSKHIFTCRQMPYPASAARKPINNPLHCSSENEMVFACFS